MKLAFIAPDNWLNKLKEELKKTNDVVNNPDSNCDAIIGMSVSEIDRIQEAKKEFPDIPMFNYNWDIYEWVWNNPREEDKNYRYKEYGELLKQSAEVWCPSQCTVERTKQWFGVESKVIRTFVEFFEADVKNGDYLLNPLRKIPDKYWGRFEKTCGKLGIRYISSQHDHSWEDYVNLVVNAKGIVSPLYELSTGGLTCLEAYYLGKPVLLSDSPWHGGKDYFGDRATYFKHNDQKDFEDKLKDMWKNPNVVEVDKDALREEFSVARMAKEICDSIIQKVS